VKPISKFPLPRFQSFLPYYWSHVHVLLSVAKKVEVVRS